MKLGVVGSRFYTNRLRVRTVIERYMKQYKDLTIVSGGCPRGADLLAKEIALELGLKYVEFPPIHARHNQYCINPPSCYNKPYDVRNFFERNTEIPNYSDHVIAFKDQGSAARGTMDTVTKARNLGKPVFVFEDRDEEPLVEKED